jgi:hypothetical protein
MLNKLEITIPKGFANIEIIEQHYHYALSANNGKDGDDFDDIKFNLPTGIWSIDKIDGKIVYLSKEPVEVITKEELLSRDMVFTFGNLKEWCDKFSVPDNAVIMIERVYDFYYDHNHWGVYKKKSEFAYDMERFNENILDKEEYPHPMTVPFTEEQIKDSYTQYTRAWSCAYYSDDKEMLFINLHY